MGRINYATILAKYKRVNKANVRLTQSTLFLTKPISATATTYNFDVLETQTSTLQADEIRLNLNDEFIITTMGMYLIAEQQTGDGAGATLTGVKRLFTYAPMQLDGVTAAKLQNFYAGALQISVNNIVYLDKWDTRKHEFVPRTQDSNFQAAAAAFQATQGLINANEFSKNAMFPVEPLLTLSGAKKNNITLQLPTALTSGTFTLVDDKGATNTWVINRVGLLVRGLNAQNGASFQN